MAELPHSSRSFRSPPPNLDTALQAWFNNITLMLGRFYLNIREVTATTDVVLFNDDVVTCDATTAAITLTLPPTEGLIGKVYIFLKSDVSANTVTIDGQDAETINGSLTKVLSSQYDSVIIISTGTAWLVLSAS